MSEQQPDSAREYCGTNAIHEALSEAYRLTGDALKLADGHPDIQQKMLRLGRDDVFKGFVLAFNAIAITETDGDPSAIK